MRSSTISGVLRISGSIGRSDCTRGCSCASSSKMSNRYAHTQPNSNRLDQTGTSGMHEQSLNVHFFPVLDSQKGLYGVKGMLYISV